MQRSAVQMQNVARPTQLRLIGSDDKDVVKMNIITPYKTCVECREHQHLRIGCALYARLHALMSAGWNVERLVYVVRETA
jgi:hypothetical protein